MNQEYRGLQIMPIHIQSITKYLSLFKSAFPNFNTTHEYIEWLYFNNPNGVAVGFDAHDADKIVSHYVCVPIFVESFSKPCLLALNTATDPKYQGRGLLKVLANATYETYGKDFACVIGVANANAVKPLTRHLGFEHLGDLELRFGFLPSIKKGRRNYSLAEVEWRKTCPGRALKATHLEDGLIEFKRTLFGLLPVVAVCPIRQNNFEENFTNRFKIRFGITLDWQKNRKPWLFLPKRFKPSPLSLVFRPLTENNPGKLEAWTFPDFDAL